jgi:hypothetical protein
MISIMRAGEGGVAANNPIANMAECRHIRSLDETRWDQRLKKVAKGKPECENSE